MTAQIKGIYEIPLTIFSINNLCFISCKEDKQELSKVEEIKVHLEDGRAKGKFEDYFSSSKLIALETQMKLRFFLIQMEFIYHKGRIYILDKRSKKGVYVFNDSGKSLFF